MHDLFSIAQAADELDLLQDLELEQQKIEHELRVAKVGNIVDSLGNSVSRSQVQQVWFFCPSLTRSSSG